MLRRIRLIGALVTNEVIASLFKPAQEILRLLSLYMASIKVRTPYSVRPVVKLRLSVSIWKLWPSSKQIMSLSSRFSRLSFFKCRQCAKRVCSDFVDIVARLKSRYWTRARFTYGGPETKAGSLIYRKRAFHLISNFDMRKTLIGHLQWPGLGGLRAFRALKHTQALPDSMYAVPDQSVSIMSHPWHNDWSDDKRTQCAEVPSSAATWRYSIESHRTVFRSGWCRYLCGPSPRAGGRQRSYSVVGVLGD